MAEQVLTPKDNLARELKRFLPEISGVAVKTIDPTVVMRLVAECCEANPYLYKCSTRSLLTAAFQSAECGLDLSPALKHAYIVPRYLDGTLKGIFVPSAYGLAELAYRSGLVKIISWEPVFEGDVFDYAFGDSPFVHHIPQEQYDDYEHLLYVYAWAELMTGGKQRVVLTKKAIDKRRLMNEAVKAGKYSPWTDFPVEMSCVKGLRALCNKLPRSKQLSRALSFVDAEEAGKPELADTEVRALPENTATTRADQVLQKMKTNGKKEEAAVVPTDALKEKELEGFGDR